MNVLNWVILRILRISMHLIRRDLQKFKIAKPWKLWLKKGETWAFIQINQRGQCHKWLASIIIFFMFTQIKYGDRIDKKSEKSNLVKGDDVIIYRFTVRLIGKRDVLS